MLSKPRLQVINSQDSLLELLQHPFYSRLMKLPDCVASLKRYCLFSFIIAHYGDLLRSAHLDYLNSIARFIPQTNSYLLVMYGTSTVICAQCNDLVYF